MARSLFLLLALVRDAGAVLPLPTWPECGEPDRPDLCPSDMDEDWAYTSYVPPGSRSTVRPAELAMGSGNNVDRAWRYTTGRTDVVLAVLDSGFDWSNHRHANKILLNAGELPLPIVSDGTTAAVHDADGNGIVNVADYASDPRVDAAGGNPGSTWLLDPSDVIAAFSDGVDDDGNGYADDIAGWDFFGNDNDPYHTYNDGFGTHGDGVLEQMAAEGGDEENGDIGVCPNCAVVPIRIGDTFITDGSRVAMGIAYAVERGAVGVNMAVGALTNPDAAWGVARWAREQGTTLVGAAGDENAYHHNFPAMMDGILYVHSVRANVDDANTDVYSYLNFLNCNNYGPRLTLVAGTSDCATGAVAITTGVVGLLHSAARDNGITLTEPEVYQLLVGAVDDVHLTAEEVAEASTYPSGEGWDPFYGYGRVNAARAVERVVSGDIPPTVDVTAPGWFQTIDPSAGTLAIEGWVAADRAGSFEYVVEYGVGDDPRTWTEITRESATSRVEGTLATLDLSTLDLSAMVEAPRDETILERMDRVFAPAITVRVRVTDDASRTGELRKTFFVYDDPDLLPGFPISLGSSGESSPILVDLDDDSVFEIVIADSSGWVHAFTGTGSELPGWPVRTGFSPRFHADADPFASGDVPSVYDGMIATAAAGDLDGDGRTEVVVASGGGGVYAWHDDGTAVAGFPVWIEGREPEEYDSRHIYDDGIAGAPALYDLDDDGDLEILVAGMDQRLYVWDAAGAPWGPYPVEICAPELCGEAGTRIITSPTVGDVDNDGDVEIGLGTNETVDGGNSSISYLFDALTGASEDGWPISEGGLINEAGLLPVVGEGHPASLAFADVDGDGDLEVASPVMLGQSPLYHHDGTVARDLSYVSSGYGDGNNTNQPSFAQMTNNAAFGDLTGDGVPDYVIGGAGAYYLIALPLWSAIDWQNVVAAWDGATGELLPGWPRQIEDLQFLVAPAVADLDGDGAAEAVMGSAGYLLHAWDKDGREPEGWPKFTGNWILGSPAVGDIDGDGYLDVVVSTREGNVFAWRTRGPADGEIGWASIHHDPQNSGNYSTPLVAQAGPPRTPDDPEGGCCDGGERAALLWLAPLGLLARRRRSR
jgi:hypothetical protein